MKTTKNDKLPQNITKIDTEHNIPTQISSCIIQKKRVHHVDLDVNVQKRADAGKHARLGRDRWQCYCHFGTGQRRPVKKPGRYPDLQAVPHIDGNSPNL